MVEPLWTWTGTFFGYRDVDDVWSRDGEHVGRCDDQDVFGPDGDYLGQVDGDRLLRSLLKKTWVSSPFSALPARGPLPRHRRRGPLAFQPNCTDFPCRVKAEARKVSRTKPVDSRGPGAVLS